jgi:hypothetical protein
MPPKGGGGGWEDPSRGTTTFQRLAYAVMGGRHTIAVNVGAEREPRGGERHWRGVGILSTLSAFPIPRC